MNQTLTAVPFPVIGERTWGPVCLAHPDYYAGPTDNYRSSAEAFAKALVCSHPDHAKAYTLRYETDARGFEEIVTRFTDNPRAVELLGRSAAKRADRGTVWNIEVLDKSGQDVTFDFKCFQDED